MREMICETLDDRWGRPAPPRDPLMAGGRSVACGRQVAPWHRPVAPPESKFAVFLRRRRWDCLSSFRWLTSFFFFFFT